MRSQTADDCKENHRESSERQHRRTAPKQELRSSMLGELNMWDFAISSRDIEVSV
jgi:hypothetical protein